MSILILGGAGYLGSVLTESLVKCGEEVTVYDNLMFNQGDIMLRYCGRQNFKFVKGDIRDKDKLAKEVKKHDIIVALAAIVGYPACRANPQLAKEVNVDGTKNLIQSLSKDQIVIYSSTGSNYGAVDDICDENTPLKPLSCYGNTKTLAEKMLLDRGNTIAYRFATAFGVSPRLRLDLLINDFTFKCKEQGYLVVYEKNFMRTFIHVNDIAEAFLFAINNYNELKMLNQVYNVGDDSLNYSKQEICDIIGRKTKAYVHYADVGSDADKRNYIVNYSKIKSLGYKTHYDVEYGIDELLKAFEMIHIPLKYRNA